MVELLQFLQGNMGVYLRTGQVRVAKQFLNGPQIRPAPQEVGGKRVSQGMRRTLPMDSGLPEAFLKNASDRSRAERGALAVEKKGISAEGSQRLISKIGRESILGGLPQHASSLFSAFSLEQAATCFQVQILFAECN